jgi:hypothetical protein
MNKLTRKEEELMKILWQIKEGFVKDIVAFYPDPKAPLQYHFLNGAATGRKRLYRS